MPSFTFLDSKNYLSAMMKEGVFIAFWHQYSLPTQGGQKSTKIKKNQKKDKILVSITNM
jgi:hypothetical protein